MVQSEMVVIEFTTSFFLSLARIHLISIPRPLTYNNFHPGPRKLRRNAQDGLKDATKDIDLVCKDKEDKARMLEAARSLGFRIVGPEKRHARLGLGQCGCQGRSHSGHLRRHISYDFGLSEAMWSRGRSSRTLGKTEMRYAALEDIFILKLIANREKDIEDCEALAPAGLDYETHDSQCI
jgi:hypothetical protein